MLESYARPRIYRTNDVAAILGVEVWRVKNFVQGKSFGLFPNEQTDEKPGKRGKQRQFSFEDLMRIDLANALSVAGFTPEVTGAALLKVTATEVRRWVNSYTADASRESVMLVQMSGKWKVLNETETKAAFADASDGYDGFFSLNLAELWEATVRSIDRLSGQGKI